MSADLHLHTIASDGSWTPEELVAQAVYRGFSTIAITDHDSTDSVRKAINCAPKDLVVIPGIELSTDYKGLEVHILGYFIDISDQTLQATLVKRRESRVQRAETMVLKLNSIGIPLTYESVSNLAKDGAVGRPHVAQALVNQGYALSVAQAFTNLIGKDGPAYVPHFKLTPEQAIELILNCRGIPVLAHPGLIGEDSLINQLIKTGLAGLEVLHSSHTTLQRSHYLNLCKQYPLLPTGGSDCHGLAGKDQLLFGSIRVPDLWVCQLMEYLESHSH